jgi:hypothetical protein
MSYLVLNPRDIVLHGARAAGCEVRPVTTADRAGEFATQRPIVVADVRDALAVARAIRADGTDAALIGLGDDSVQLAALVNTGLGRRPVVGFEAAERFRRKDLLRARLADSPYGLDFCCLADPNGVAAYLSRHGPDSWHIVKPVDGQGSRDVQRLSYADLVRQSAGAASDCRSPHCIVEEYVDGDEYSVEALTLGPGRHLAYAVTKKYLEPGTFVEAGHRVPGTESADRHRALVRAATETLTRAGLDFGLSHTEIRLSGRGPKIIESHARPGGDFISDAVRSSYEVNPFALLFDALQGAEVSAPAQAACVAGVQYLALSDWSDDARWQTAALSVGGVRWTKILRPSAERGSVRSSADRHAVCLFTAATVEQSDDIRTELLTLRP